MQITGIILAGGKSTRMGTDKALMKIEGETLLTRAVKLCHLVCDQVLISSNSENHDFDGVVRIADDVKDCGPMGGIYSCLKHAENDWCFVLSVDVINITSDFVLFLLKHAENFDAVVPVHENGKEPLVALYHKNCTNIIKHNLESGNFKMHDFLDTIKTNFVDAQKWELTHPGIFHNINYPTDLPG